MKKNYLEEKIDTIFPRKDLKNNKIERLRELNNLLLTLKKNLEENDQLLSYFIVKSYETYNGLVSLNHVLKNKYDQNAHLVYIYARLYASYHYFEGEELLEEANKIEQDYYESKPYPKELDLNNKLYKKITRLAILEEVMDKRNMEHKKKKDLTKKELELLKEKELIKSLIY